MGNRRLPVLQLPNTGKLRLPMAPTSKTEGYCLAAFSFSVISGMTLKRSATSP